MAQFAHGRNHQEFDNHVWKRYLTNTMKHPWAHSSKQSCQTRKLHTRKHNGKQYICFFLFKTTSDNDGETKHRQRINTYSYQTVIAEALIANIKTRRREIFAIRSYWFGSSLDIAGRNECTCNLVA